MTLLTPEEINEKMLYNVLQDRLFLLGTNAVVKMNIMLYRTDNSKNQRYHFYDEYQYVDKNGYLARRLNRNFNPFVTIDNLKPVNGVFESIMIRGRDLELLRMFLIPKLEAIIQNFDKIFEMRDNKLYCNDDIKPIEITFSYREKTIWVKPGLHQMYSDEIIPCIDMYLNSPNNMTVLNFPMLYEFMYFIRTFNIYQYAATMLASFGNMPMGYNLTDNSNNQIERITENKQYNYEAQQPLKLKRRPEGFFANMLRNKQNNEGDVNNDDDV